MPEFFVLPTGLRDDSHGEYIVRLSIASVERIFGSNQPKLVAISYKNPKLEGIEISALAWLRVGTDDDRATNDHVQMDQTLRQSLGLSPQDYSGEKVTISAVEDVSWIDETVAKTIGRRLVYCRPAILQPLDLEKNVVRLHRDAMEVIGIKSGEIVVISGLEKSRDGKFQMKTRRVTALEASEPYIRFYDEQTKQPSMTDRYTNVAALLGQPDLHKVFLDLESRNDLFGLHKDQDVRTTKNISDAAQLGLYLRTVQCAQPVIVQRAPSTVIAHEMLNVGSLAVAALALLVAITPDISLSKMLWYLVAVIIAAAISLLFVVLKNRMLWR